MRLAFFGSDDFSLTFFKNLVLKPFTKIVVHSSHPAGSLMSYTKGKYETKIVSSFQFLDDGFDLAISASFGLFIPERIVSSVPIFLNVHPSLLPRYRGSSPIQRSIMEDVSKIGITIIDMEGKTFDSGRIWYQQSINQDPLNTDFKKMEAFLAKESSLAMNSMISSSFKDIVPRKQIGIISLAPKILPIDYEVLFHTMTRRQIILKYNALSHQRSLFTTFVPDGRRIQLVNISSSQLLLCKGSPGDVFLDKRLRLIWIMCMDKQWLGVSSFRIEGKSSLFDWGNSTTTKTTMGSSSSKPLQEPLNIGRRNPAIVRPSAAITERDRAVLDLKIQRDRLKQYQKKLLVIIERENEIAKLQLRQGNRDRALLALRKKKYQQNLLNNTFSQLLTVEELTMSIEFTQVQQDVIEGLKGGNEILNTIQKELKLEDVEQLMADTSEAIRYQNSISDALAGLLTDAEEDDLQSELDQILLEKMPTLSDLKLPAVALKKVVDDVDAVDVAVVIDKDNAFDVSVNSLINNSNNNNEEEQYDDDEDDDEEQENEQEELVNY